MPPAGQDTGRVGRCRRGHHPRDGRKEEGNTTDRITATAVSVIPVELEVLLRGPLNKSLNIQNCQKVTMIVSHFPKGRGLFFIF